MITRRTALKQSIAAGACVTLAGGVTSFLGAQPAPAAPAGPFTLPKLPYATDALEPHIDGRTMEIHHGKHHATYVANLNKAVAGKPELAGKSVDDLLRDLAALPAEVRTAVRNQGGGHYNHSLFWQMMKKGGGGEPGGKLQEEIARSFGSFAKFKEDFSKAALGQFGSGWAWLLWNGTKLEVKGLPNQDAPIAPGTTALLGIDVWEHAYYLKYQNRRADYISAFFNVVAWDFVEDRFARKA
ncbi:MAG TPA: superoxide dismutase [Verrucomicrobiales bacterium]|nr:superoxide dismutase [Verrucomicrobiales bacterium]